MKINNDEKSKRDQFFKNLKQYMKQNGREISLSDLKGHKKVDGTSLIHLLTEFITEQVRSPSLTESQIQQVLKKLIEDRKSEGDQYKIEKNYICYVSKYKNIVNEETLIKEVEKNPKGLLVDDELLKLTCDGIKEWIGSAIEQRKIFSMKSVQKLKNSEERYLGYILFPIPNEVKAYSQNLFKIKSSQIEKQIMGERPLKRRLEVKTCDFRNLYEKSCRQNLNKILTEAKIDIQSSERRTNSQWEQINRNCIENYDQLIEEYKKKMEKKG